MNWRLRHYGSRLLLHGAFITAISMLGNYLLFRYGSFHSPILIDMVVITGYLFGALGWYKRAGFLILPENHELLMSLKQGVWGLERLNSPIDKVLLEQVINDATSALRKNEDIVYAIKHVTPESQIKAMLSHDELSVEMHFNDAVQYLLTQVADARKDRNLCTYLMLSVWIEKLESIANLINQLKSTEVNEKEIHSRNDVLKQNYSLLLELRNEVNTRRTAVQLMKNLVENLYLKIVQQGDNNAVEINSAIKQLKDQREILLATNNEMKQLSA